MNSLGFGVWEAIGQLAVIFVMIGVLFVAISKFGNNININWGVLIAAFVGLGAMIWVLGDALSKMGDVEWSVVAAFTVGSAILLATLAFVLPALAALDISSALKGCLALIAFAAAFGLAIALVGGLGEQGLDAFGRATTSIGGALQNLTSLLSGVDWEVPSKLKQYVADMLSIFGDMATGNYNGSDDFKNALKDIGVGMRLFQFLGGNSSTQTGDGQTIKQFATDVSEALSKLSGITNAGQIKTMLTEVGGALGIFYGNLSDIEIEDGKTVSPEQLQAAFDALAAVNIDESAIANVASYAENGEGTTLGDFAIGIQNLSEAIGNYGDKIGGLNLGSVLLANLVLSTISGISVNLSGENTGFNSLISWVTGSASTLSQFSEDIVLLGGAIQSYATSISAVKDAPIDDATKVLQDICGLDIPAEGGLFDFLIATKDKGLGNLINNLPGLGTGLANFANNLKTGNFDADQARAAMTPLNSLAYIQSKMHAIGGIESWFSGEQSLGALGDQLATFGEKLASFSGYVTDLDFGDDSNLTSAIGVLDKVGQIHSKLGDLDITQIKAFENIGSALESFFGSLGRIVTSQSSEFDKTDKKVTIDEALDAMYYFEDIDSGPFIDKITTFVNEIVAAANAADTELKTAATNLTTTKDALGGALVGASQDAFASLTSGFSTGVDTGPVDTAMSTILSVVNGYKGDFESSGENFSQGLANGIKNNVDAVIKAARTVAGMALTTLNSALQEQSPSRATAESGKYFSQGFAIGITEDEAVAKLAAKQMAKGALDEVTNETASFSDKALGMFGGLKSNLNKIYSGANLATMFFGAKKTTDIEKTQNKVLGDAKSGLQSLLGGTAIGGIVGSALSSFTSGVQGWLNGSSSGGITDWLFGGVKTGLQNVFGGFSTGGLLTTALGLNDLANPEETLKSLAAQAGYTDEELSGLTNGFFGLGSAASYASASLPAITKELKQGDWDDDQVKAMQQHLMDLGYDLSKFGADGKFGDETLAALTQFETDFGLEADGVLSTIEAKQLELEAKKAGGGTTVSFTGGETSSEDTAAASKAATDMVAAFKSHGSEFNGAGGYFTLGLAGGASKYLSTAVNAAAAVAAAMLAKVKEVFNEQSPSKETAKYGMWFDQGLAVGIRDYANEATTSSEDVANAMLKTTSGTLSNLSAILAGDIDDTPTISPVVDLTNARAAAASIGGMFGAQSVPIYSRNLAYNASNPGVASRFNTAGRSDSAVASSSDSANLASSIDTLNSRMSSLEFAIKNMKVVTETGAIIGQIASGMDDKLGEFARMHERGG